MLKNHLKLDSEFLAKVISFVSNPVLIIFLAVIIGDSEFIFANPGPLLMYISVGLFLPLIVYLYQLLKHKSHIWDFISLDRKSREPVYLVSLYTFFFNIVFFAYLNLSFWVSQSILIFVFFAVMYLANKYIDKVSMHAGAFAFSVFYLTDKASIYFVLLLLFLPLIYWSRIRLHKHTGFQLFLGTMIGALVGLISWLG